MRLVAVSILLLTSYAAPGLAGQPDRLAPMAELTGCWAVTATETNTEGELLEQTGTVAVRTTLGGEALEFSYTLEVERATGHYRDVAEERRFREEISFNATTGLLEIARSRPGSPAPRVSSAAVSADGKEIFRTFLFYHSGRGMTLFGEDRLVLMSRDEVSNTTEIRDVFGDYRETFSAIWRRVAS